MTDQPDHEDRVDFDLNALTLGDIEDIEDAAGRSFSDLFPDGQPSAKGLIAFVYVTRRRDDPEFTWDDARKVKIVELAEPDEVPPTGEAA